MAGHEKTLREEPEVENCTNGAQEESRSVSQDEIPTRKVQRIRVSLDGQDQLTTVDYLPRQLGKQTCWTGEVQLDERLSFRAF